MQKVKKHNPPILEIFQALRPKRKNRGRTPGIRNRMQIRLLRKPTKTPEIQKNTKRQSNIGKAYAGCAKVLYVMHIGGYIPVGTEDKRGSVDVLGSHGPCFTYSPFR
jgi:hypothetical protein